MLDKADRRSLRAGVVLFAVIAAVMFVTSFDAIRAVAVDRGVVRPGLGWAIPVGIDGLVLAASLAAWVDARHRTKWHPFPVAVVAVAAGLSVAANVAHAAGRDPLSLALAAFPPIGLLLAIELGAWQLRSLSRQAIVDRPQHVDDAVDVDGATSSSAPARPLLQTTAAPSTPTLQPSTNGDRFARVWRTLEQLDPHPTSVRDAAARTDLSRHAITQAQRADLARWGRLIRA